MTITNRVSLKSVMGGNTPIADVVDAPTIGTATAGTEAATVVYTAAATGGTATSFTATSTPDSITGTGASPITVSGLTGGTAYTFKVYGTNASGVWSGVQSAASNSVTPAVATAFESIATVIVGSGGTSAVTFSSIPSTYQHLQVRLIARSDVANIQHNLLMRINGDTGANYSWHQLIGDSQTAYVQSQSSVTAITNVATITGASESANIFVVAVVDVLDYANTNKNKTVRSLNGKEDNTTGTTNGIVALCSGAWFNTSAANSLTFYSGGSGNLVQYSSFALYGIKG